MGWGRWLTEGGQREPETRRETNEAEEKFPKRKTHKATFKETRELAQSGRCKKGAFISGQDLQDEELGDGLGEGSAE